jgi:hypothetical protein
LPYPDDDARSWWAVFQDLVTAIDATLFATMEANAWTFEALPDATVESDGGTGYQLRLLGPLVAVSRTLQASATVAAGTLALTPEWLIVVPVAAGASTAGTTALEIVQNGVPVHPDYRVLGVVRSDYSIIWWNAAVLVVGDTRRLFAHESSSVASATWAEGLSSDGGTTNVSTAAQVATHRADVTIHRSINDAAITTTALWSAAKIHAELATAGQRRPFALDIVDPTVAPPGGASAGDSYLLAYSVGVVDAGWGVGAQPNDHVTYSGTAWVHDHPLEGWDVYVQAAGVDMGLVYNVGAAHYEWVEKGGAGGVEEFTATWDQVVGAGSTALGSASVVVDRGIVYSLKIETIAGVAPTGADLELADGALSGAPELLYQIGSVGGVLRWDPSVAPTWKDRNPFGVEGLSGTLYWRLTNAGAAGVTFRVTLRGMGASL